MTMTIVRDDDPVEHESPAGPEALDRDELCRIAAREMLAVARQAERRAWLAAHTELLDEEGHRLMAVDLRARSKAYRGRETRGLA